MGSQTKKMNENNELSFNRLKDIDSFTQFERNIAKKLMLSIRYFCEDDVIDESTSDWQKRCLNPVVTLPASLNNFLSQIELAGVVLFSENIVSVEQTKKLTSD